jgi:hypothetical protein
MTLLDLYKLLIEAGIPVAHYETELEEYPYIIYQELTTSYTWASGRTLRENVKVEVVHFTKTEFDPSLEILKAVLLKNKLGFTIATAFDPDAKNIINQFEITITRDREV